MSVAQGADNEIWSYGEEIYNICKNYIMIRAKLQPYIQQLMRAAHETGCPVIRPLFFDFFEDPESWEIEDQYMFGPDILVSPVLSYGCKNRGVYLPSGCQWQNAWSGESFCGGQSIEVMAPIEQMPLFIREGSTVSIV